MTDFLFANNATTQVASALTSGGTSLQVSTGSGALFPAPAANQQFAVKLADAATGLITEIVYCTGVTGDTLTIVRAQEGTTARAWNVGDTVLCGPTAGQMQTFAQPSTLQAQAGNFGTDTGSANAMAVTLTPAPYAYTAGLTLRVLKSAATNTGAMTINVNGLGAKSIIYPGGGAIQAGQALASSVMMLVYDGTAFEWVGSAAPAWRTVSSGPWYVNASTGSDSNNGLTSGTAWATIQHAVSQIQHNYDLGGAAATVNLLGAFTAGFTVNQPWVGGTVIFDGGSSSTTSIEPASTSAVIGTGSGVDFTIQNVTLAAPGAAKAALVATVNAVVNLGNGVMFGQCGAAQILASFGGTVSGGGAADHRDHRPGRLLHHSPAGRRGHPVGQRRHGWPHHLWRGLVACAFCSFLRPGCCRLSCSRNPRPGLVRRPAARSRWPIARTSRWDAPRRRLGAGRARRR